MQKQSPFRKWMGLISLGYMGGMIYVPLYLRYVFYDQLMQTMQVNNAQLAMLNTVNAAVAFIVSIPGAYLADKFDAKKVIVFSIGGIAVITFIFAAFTSSYTMALILWAAQAIVMASYWACLIKYINNLGGEEDSGNSFGMYNMINGISGALGNAAPLWFATHFGGMRPAILAIGAMLALATVLVFLFLDNEKKLAERGVYLKGDEPIQLKHIPYVLK